MARPVAIGDYQSQVPVEEGLRRIIPTRTGASIGPGVEALAEGAQRLEQSEAANYTLQALSKAQSDWTQEYHDRTLNAQPGAPNFTPSLMGDYDKYVKDQVKGAPNQMAGRFLQQRLTEFGSHLAQQSISFEAGAKQSHNEDVAKQAADMTSVEMQNNPQVYPQRLSERLAAIDTMQMEPQAKEKLADYTKQTLSRFAVMGDIQRDPYGTMTKLTDTKSDGYYANLTAEQRDSLMDHADRMLHERVSDAERVHQLAKQQQQDNSDNLLKQGIVMSAKGGLTPQWVISHANSFEPYAMKYLLEESSGKKTESDIHVYSDLLTRAAHGEDTTEDAKTALFGGQLSKEDFTKISDMGAKDQPNWFKRGDQYIQTSLQVSQLEPDPAKSQTLANARNDWQDWKQSHPQATDTDAEKAYTGIVNRYQIVKGEQSMLTLPVPDHFVGSRTQPDMPGSKKSLVKAFKEGEINKDQFDKEAAVLQKWDQAVMWSQKQKAAAAARAKANE